MTFDTEWEQEEIRRRLEKKALPTTEKVFDKLIRQPTRRLVVIEAPYAQDPAAMTAYLRECIVDTLRRGESAMASVPIYAMTGALDDLKPEERAVGIAAGLEWYRVAEACVVYTDHGISKGMQQGMYRAQEHKVPIEIRELYPERNIDEELMDIGQHSGRKQP